MRHDGRVTEQQVVDGVEADGPYCGRCGEPERTAAHLDCDEALDLEPPRFCFVCRRRMVVQILPAGWTATCSRHGTTDGGEGVSGR